MKFFVISIFSILILNVNFSFSSNKIDNNKIINGNFEFNFMKKNQNDWYLKKIDIMRSFSKSLMDYLFNKEENKTKKIDSNRHNTNTPFRWG